MNALFAWRENGGVAALTLCLLTMFAYQYTSQYTLQNCDKAHELKEEWKLCSLLPLQQDDKIDFATRASASPLRPLRTDGRLGRAVLVVTCCFAAVPLNGP